jgi:hypothetical protein
MRRGVEGGGELGLVMSPGGDGFASAGRPWPENCEKNIRGPLSWSSIIITDWLTIRTALKIRNVAN